MGAGEGTLAAATALAPTAVGALEQLRKGRAALQDASAAAGVNQLLWSNLEAELVAAEAAVEDAECRYGLHALQGSPKVKGALQTLSMRIDLGITLANEQRSYRWLPLCQPSNEALSGHAEWVRQWRVDFEELVAKLPEDPLLSRSRDPPTSAEVKSWPDTSTESEPITALAQVMNRLGIGYMAVELEERGLTLEELKDEGAWREFVEGPCGSTYGLSREEYNLLKANTCGRDPSYQHVVDLLEAEDGVESSMVHVLDRQGLTYHDVLGLSPADIRRLYPQSGQQRAIERVLNKCRLERASNNCKRSSGAFDDYARTQSREFTDGLATSTHTVVEMLRKMVPVHGCRIEALRDILRDGRLRARKLTADSQGSLFDVLREDHFDVFEKFTRLCPESDSDDDAGAGNSHSKKCATFLGHRCGRRMRRKPCVYCTSMVLNLALVHIQSARFGSTRGARIRRAILQGSLKAYSSLTDKDLREIDKRAAQVDKKLEQVHAGCFFWMDEALQTDKRNFALLGPNVDYGPCSLLLKREVLENPRTEVLVNSAVSMVNGSALELRPWAATSRSVMDPWFGVYIDGHFNFRLATLSDLGGKATYAEMMREVTARKNHLVEASRLSLNSSVSEATYQWLAQEITAQAKWALAGQPVDFDLAGEQNKTAAVEYESQLQAFVKSHKGEDYDVSGWNFEALSQEGRDLLKTSHAEQKMPGRIAASVRGRLPMRSIGASHACSWYSKVDSHGRCEVHLPEEVPLDLVRCIIFSERPPHDILEALDARSLQYRVVDGAMASATLQAKYMGLDGMWSEGTP